MGQRSSKQLSVAFAPGVTERIDTHTSIREEVYTEPLYTRTIPLCSRFPSNGSIHLKYNNPYEPYVGLFSFTIYYYGSLADFRNSPYFIGLLLYAEFIHNLAFFNPVGMILYTDRETYPTLRQLFGSYEKVIFAITDWPAFNIENKVERTILRCMRLHALEAFPAKWICVRDADTIFPHELFLTNEMYSKGYKGKDSKGVVQEDYRIFLMNEIGKWENQFINTWLLDIKNTICLGASPTYRAIWHTNSVLRWPAKQSLKLRDRMADKKIYGLRFGSPLGIWAGFTNFAQERPNDLWFLCYDYIIRRYFLINGIDGITISNDDSIIDMGRNMDIGKDERILLFGILPKYVKLTYFFWIDYQDNIRYDNVKLSNRESYSSLESIGIAERTLLTFGTIKRQYPNNNKSMSNDINIKTLMLQPAYVDIMHKGLKLNRKLLEQLQTYEYSERLERYMPMDINSEELLNRNINDLFKVVFEKFIYRYNTWLSKYTTMPNSDFSKIINALKAGNTSRQREYATVTNADFISPPGRILPSSNQTRPIAPPVEPVVEPAVAANAKEKKFKAGIVLYQSSPYLNTIRNTARYKPHLAEAAGAKAPIMVTAKQAAVSNIIKLNGVHPGVAGGKRTRRRRTHRRKTHKTHKGRRSYSLI
jgi:hypothetical protein